MSTEAIILFLDETWTRVMYSECSVSSVYVYNVYIGRSGGWRRWRVGHRGIARYNPTSASAWCIVLQELLAWKPIWQRDQRWSGCIPKRSWTQREKTCWWVGRLVGRLVSLDGCCSVREVSLLLWKMVRNRWEIRNLGQSPTWVHLAPWVGLGGIQRGWITLAAKSHG